MKIQTMTVRLGLSRATLLAIVLVSLGAALTGTGLLLEWVSKQQSWLGVFLLAIPVAVLFVIGKFRQLCSLSKEYEAPGQNQRILEEEIVELSSNNPKWIMIVTQTYSALSIVLLATKFI